MGQITNPPYSSASANAGGAAQNPAVLPYGQRVFGSGSYVVFIVAGTYIFTVPAGINKIRVRQIGASGSGAAVHRDGGRWAATGGAGGGYAEKAFDVVPGQTYLITVGAGGVAVTAAVGTSVNGSPGGSTSFGAVFSATGGEGGKASTAENVVPALPVAGSGVGGDLNYVGGTSGSITFHAAAGMNRIATGGGSAATWLGAGYSSGDAVATDFNLIGTGGAGVGGRSGAVTGGAGPNKVGFSGGSGTGGKSANLVNMEEGLGGADVFGVSAAVRAAGSGLPSSVIPRFLGDVVTGGGGGAGSGSNGGNGGPGAGGGGANSSPVGGGGVFGGGGPYAHSGAAAAAAGKGGLGAGGGGCAISNIAGSATSGGGNDGFCLVEW